VDRVDDAGLEVLARRDLARLRHPQGWLMAGVPRFARLFGRDALISAWQLLDDDPDVARATLAALAARQGQVVDDRREEEPGKIPHEVPVDRFDVVRMHLRKRFRWGFPYYGSADATALFVVVLDAAVAATGDERLWAAHRDAVRRACAWAVTWGDLLADGLVRYERRNPHGLAHQGWRDHDLGAVGITPPVALVEVQGYWCAAERAAARLERAAGDPARAAALDERAAARATALRRFRLDDDAGYALAIDGAGRPVDVPSSNQGHLLVCGVLDAADAALVADRLARPDLSTPYGLRTQSTAAPAFDARSYHRGSVWPHDCWIVHEGLRAVGRHDQATALRRGVLAACRELGAIPELYGVVDDRVVALPSAQPVQAWAAGAVLSFLVQERSARAAAPGG
jgi:glycogen debranching enzyme